MRLAAAPSLLATVTAAALTPAAPARADDPPAGWVPPDQDPFYSAPGDIGDCAPGQVVALFMPAEAQ
jgi:hypothetical protein